MVTITDRIRSLAEDFTDAAIDYEHTPGRHDELLADEMRRTSTVLRFVGVCVDDNVLDQDTGYVWYRAGRKLLARVKEANQ